MTPALNDSSALYYTAVRRARNQQGHARVRRVATVPSSRKPSRCTTQRKATGLTGSRGRTQSTARALPGFHEPRTPRCCLRRATCPTPARGMILIGQASIRHGRAAARAHECNHKNTCSKCQRESSSRFRKHRADGNTAPGVRPSMAEKLSSNFDGFRSDDRSSFQYN